MATILIVDDQPSNRRLVATLARYAGHRTLEAGNGSLALELVRRERPDLVVCDLLMPVMDGYEFVRQLRAQDSTANTRVIFYTATYLEREANALAAACGVQYLLFKPCEPEVILQTIALALQQQTHQGQRFDTENFDREHLRLLSDKLAVKVEELESLNTRLRREIAERQRATGRLKESELRFRQIAENIREVFFLSDPLGEKCFYISPAYEDIFGRSCERLYANPRSWVDAVHVDDRKRVARCFAEGQSGVGFELEYRIHRADGEERFIRTRGFPIRQDAGPVCRLAGVAEDVTEQVRLREALQAREAGLRRAQSLAKLAHLITRPDGAFESWSDSLPALIALPVQAMPTCMPDWLARVHPDDQAQFRATCIDADTADMSATLDYRFLNGAGEWICLHQEFSPLQSHAETPGEQHGFSTLQDVSAQKAAEQKIYRLNRVYAMLSSISSLSVRSSSRLQILRESCQVAVEFGQYKLAWIGMLEEGSSECAVQAWYGDDGQYVQWIHLTTDPEAPYGSRPASRALQCLQPFVTNDVCAEPALADMVDAMAMHGLRSQASFPLIIDNKAVGVLTLCSTDLNAFDAQETQLLEEVSGNISFALDHIQKGERLKYLAYFDTLTGLPNSAQISERLEQGVAAFSDHQRMLGLVLLDVERFKAVNHVFGRHGGDSFLQQLAGRMREAADSRVFAARISADGYAIIFEHIRHPAELDQRLEAHYHQWFDAPFTVLGQPLHASAKLGIAIYPRDGADAEQLYRNAETALKYAKRSTERGRFYDVRMAQEVSERLALDGKLRLALERDEFVLHYQVKVDVESRRVEGVEALIRWNSPDLGLIPPVRFIPLLEETGLIVDVGLWALRRASLDYARWLAQGLAAPRIAVNVSAVQLRKSDFVSQVAALLSEVQAMHGIDIELTESLLMDDVQSNIEKLHALRALDVRLSIDDFGTGYSSLAYLSKLPAEILKIDRSFILTMLDDPDNMTLVSTMISLAHSLRMKVVAEGVETEAQVEILRQLHCDQMQGYLIARPVPFDALVLQKIVPAQAS